MDFETKLQFFRYVFIAGETLLFFWWLIATVLLPWRRKATSGKTA